MDTRRLWRMWWSGALAMVAVGHLARVLGGWPVRVGTLVVPLWFSWVHVLLAGSAAAWLMRLALEADERDGSMLAPWERLGGCHPTVRAQADQPEGAHAVIGAADGHDEAQEDQALCVVGEGLDDD